MEVKCPKCRFRYDTPVSSGVNEVACVCPRCGLPFTLSMTVKYKLQEGGKEVLMEEQKPLDVQQKSSNMQEKTAAQSPRTQESEPTRRTEPSSTNNPPPFVPSIGGRNVRPSYSRDRRSQSSNHGCLRNCLLVFMVTFIVSVFIVRNCGSNRSYTQDSLQGENAKEVVAGQRNEARSGEEKPPSWLEGSWRAETDQGVVVITIYGNRIVELFDGEESRGTFVYKRAKLYCDFGDGEPVIRKVDRKRRQLFFDDLPMVKQ